MKMPGNHFKQLSLAIRLELTEASDVSTCIPSGQQHFSTVVIELSTTVGQIQLFLVHHDNEREQERICGQGLNTRISFETSRQIWGSSIFWRSRMICKPR